MSSTKRKTSSCKTPFILAFWDWLWSSLTRLKRQNSEKQRERNANDQAKMPRKCTKVLGNGWERRDKKTTQKRHGPASDILRTIQKILDMGGSATQHEALVN